MPPAAARPGRMRRGQVESCPSKNSRLISRPTSRKNTAISASLIQCKMLSPPTYVLSTPKYAGAKGEFAITSAAAAVAMSIRPPLASLVRNARSTEGGGSCDVDFIRPASSCDRVNAGSEESCPLLFGCCRRPAHGGLGDRLGRPLIGGRLEAEPSHVKSRQEHEREGGCDGEAAHDGVSHGAPEHGRRNGDHAENGGCCGQEDGPEPMHGSLNDGIPWMQPVRDLDLDLVN